MTPHNFKSWLYEPAVHVGQFLNIAHIPALEIFKRLSEKSHFFYIIHFLQEHKNDLLHIDGDKFKLLDLDEVFSVKSYNLRALELYFRERNRIKFFRKGGQVYAKVRNFIFALPFPYGIYELVETFYQEIYGAFDVKNRNVVDVGAFIGDTSIYFASRGARKVVAFEPAINLFYLALQNVRMNNFGKVIDLRKEAVGTNCGEEKFYYMKHHPTGSSLLPRRDHICYTVKVVPLSDAIPEIGSVDLLKIDCEGTEDKILLQAYKSGSLEDVVNIICEAHGFCRLKNVIRILRKASYKVSVKKFSASNLYLVYATKV